MLNVLDHLGGNVLHNENRITLPELDAELKHLNTKKAKGHDRISNKIISYILPSLAPILHPLYNILVYRGHYPMAWEGAVGLLILKPNKKKSDPGSFRPISLLCNRRKVLESIVSTRLYSWAESTNLLPPEQSRFRKKRLVNDRLFQLTQIVAQQFARHRTQHLGAIFLNIEVFDRVWHNNLRYKLLNLNLHITLHAKAIHSVASTKFLGITFDTMLYFTKHFHAITNLARHHLLKLLSLSTSTHGP